MKATLGREIVQKKGRREAEREKRSESDGKKDTRRGRRGVKAGGGGGTPAFYSWCLLLCVWSANQRNVSALISCL